MPDIEDPTPKRTSPAWSEFPPRIFILPVPDVVEKPVERAIGADFVLPYAEERLI
jgi:hypothetical protein